MAVGAALMFKGAAGLATREPSSLAAWSLGPPALLSGSALVVGFLTPGAGVLAAVVMLGGVVARHGLAVPGTPEDGAATALLVVMTAAVALVGPGAFSVDARLFGRREIVVPGLASRSSPD